MAVVEGLWLSLSALVIVERPDGVGNDDDDNDNEGDDGDTGETVDWAGSERDEMFS